VFDKDIINQSRPQNPIIKLVGFFYAFAIFIIKVNVMRNIFLVIGLLFGSIVYGQNLPRIEDLDDQIIYHHGFTLSYNETCEQPNWVLYQVTKEDLENKVAKRKNNFKEDVDIITGSATPQDYYKSGFDRGHLAPAATFVDDQREMDESFLMSNMSPQNPSFNRGVWKRLEEYERKMAMEKDSVWVISGPVLNTTLPKIGDNRVCIPELYYKVIYTEGFIMCFILKNEKSSEPLYVFKQPLDVVQRMVGINFMIE
jgi:endonuclease G